MKTKKWFAVILSVLLGANVCGAQQVEKHEDVLIAYFSATGNTAAAARVLAEVTDGQLYAITPEKAYTAGDLNWRNERSRSSVEMKDEKARPAMKGSAPDLSGVKVVYIGYPIWWGVAPRIINTFIEKSNLAGKVLVPFATSGGSGVAQSVAALKAAYPDLDWRDGKLLNRAGAGEVRSWVEGISATR